MFSHARLILLGVAALISVSCLHDAFAGTRASKPAPLPVAIITGPQSAQVHLFTGTTFRAASIGY
jgi:hypothetical protein